MAARASLATIITRVRVMINDPIVNNVSQFSDDFIQATLDEYRDDLRYEGEIMAPSIVNTASTGNQATVIFADYYSNYQFWEDDVVLQAVVNGAAWKVVTPAASEPIVGHWQFETDVFNTGTAPGQLPPVWATGKVHDLFAASADLLDFWTAAAVTAGAYDITVDGQSLKRSQLYDQRAKMACLYRKRSKPKTAKMIRTDVEPEMNSMGTRLLDMGEGVRGVNYR